MRSRAFFINIDMKPSLSSVLLAFIILVVLTLGETRHLLRKLQETSDTDLSQLRYLTLGASATYGVTLPDRTTGYPYQLSANVANLAIRASGPNYPSICIQSIVGDDNIYDVIILEYLMACSEGLDILALRLRQRFPDAIIIFNMQWVPTLITGKDKEGLDTSFNSISTKYNFQRPMTPNDISIVMSEMETFELHPNVMKDVIAYHERISNIVNGHLFGIEELKSTEWNNKEWVAQRLSFFNDRVHYSQTGHDFVANGIKELLRKLNPKPSDNVGTFGDGDSCHMWYNSGDVTIKYNEGVIKFNEFSQAKYALEIPSQGGELYINNPFDSPRQLMMTYMTTGPSETIYPQAKIFVNEEYNEQFVVNPLATEYRFKVHISKTTSLGKIPPGENKIFVKPLEEKEQLFRVVALSVVGDANPDSNFAPGPADLSQA